MNTPLASSDSTSTLTSNFMQVVDTCCHHRGLRSECEHPDGSLRLCKGCDIVWCAICHKEWRHHDWNMMPYSVTTYTSPASTINFSVPTGSVGASRPKTTLRDKLKYNRSKHGTGHGESYWDLQIETIGDHFKKYGLKNL